MYINNRWILIITLSLLLIHKSTYDYTNYNLLSMKQKTIKLKHNFQSQEHRNDIEINLSDLENFISQILKTDEPMANLYKEPSTQKLVEEFLIDKIGSQEIVDTVLLYSSQTNLPLKVVFSLIFVESSYSKYAVNYNATSKDYGLFQLNSKTFRHLTKEEFFHLETNVKMGISYLNFAFGLDPDPKIALAIYNAGPSRPLRGNTPESTKLYVSKILAYSEKLEDEFVSFIWDKLDKLEEHKKSLYVQS